MTGRGDMDREARPRWGPDPEGDPLMTVRLARWDSSLLERVGRVEKGLGVPVQAVRGDRVLSREHLLAARWHAMRALHAGRSRLQDPGVAFLCFLSAKRQIAQAIEELGVPLERPGVVPVLLVALGEMDEDRFMHQLRSVGFEPVFMQGEIEVAGASAEEYWDRRLGLGGEASHVMRLDRLLAKMALVSLEA